MHLSHVLGVSAALACSSLAMAHEFWIQPATFRALPGEVVSLRLFVGDDFPGESVARNPPRIEKFVVSGAAGEELAVVGRAGAEPAGMMRFPEAGTYVAVYDSIPSFVSVEPEKFEAYLRDKGLAEPAKLRAERSETDKPGRELYSRCAKTILEVGNGPRDGYDRDFGMRLEIIPESHPGRVAPGASFPVRVTFEGKPLAGATIVAMSPACDDLRTTTDAEGRARLTLPADGMWVLSCVHMVAAARDDPAGHRADWESLWASLTFEIPSNVNQVAR